MIHVPFSEASLTWKFESSELTNRLNENAVKLTEKEKEQTINLMEHFMCNILHVNYILQSYSKI